ncbi:MAG: hypothetical protein IRZ13_04300 [Acetobacteraceae bacterium]|nr:hypothetical protein [Acetobacteraceae bacterium]
MPIVWGSTDRRSMKARNQRKKGVMPAGCGVVHARPAEDEDADLEGDGKDGEPSQMLADLAREFVRLRGQFGECPPHRTSQRAPRSW